MIDELLTRQLRLTPIFACQPVATDIQFARHADWHRLASFVQYVDLGVGDRTAERDGVAQFFRSVHGTATGKSGVLGGAIAVDDPTFAQLGQ